MTDLSSRPRATLGRVLDDLGATLIDYALGVHPARQVSGVAIHDPSDDVPLPADSILLAVGVAGDAGIRDVLAQGAASSACAVVVRGPVPGLADLKDAVESSGVALLVLHRGASWIQLARLLSSVIGAGDFGKVDSETLGGIPSGDLFAVASAIGALLDAPITIEDRSSRVLAFAGRQDQADPSRIETILGRQVPERYAAQLTERGVFSELYRSEEPVYIPPLAGPDKEFTRPRLAIGVRAGDEILGSIWAVVSGPPDENIARSMVDAAKVVALHLLRLRAGADVERRMRADLVSTALEGGPNGADALERLGLAGLEVCVIAMQPVEIVDTGVAGVDRAEQRMSQSRLADSLAVHLVASHPRSAAAVVGDVVYGLVPAAPERAEALATDFLARVAKRHPVAVGVSDPGSGADGVSRARGQADRARRALLRRGASGSVVARISSVAVDTILMDLDDLVSSRDDVPRGAVAALRRYDADTNSQLVETLAAWLDTFGDVNVAAASVHVHPNTFRYRMRRLSEISGLDLNDPNARFAAMLELRMDAPPSGSPPGAAGPSGTAGTS